MKKILAVNGSPTMKKGMTHILMECMLNGARDAGADVDYVMLQKKKIGYCLGCFKCWVTTPGVCFQKDDMTELLEKMKTADYCILGTPLYVDGMTAQTKTFTDRIIPLVDPHFEFVDGHYRHVKRFEKRPELVLASVCGFYERDNFDGLIDHVKRICKNFQTTFAGAVVRPSSYILSMNELLPDAVKEIKAAAEQAGRDLVEKGYIPAETADAVAKDYLPKDAFLHGSNAFWDQCIEAEKFEPPK